MAGVRFLEKAEDILGFVRNCQEQDNPCALCVVTDVSGGSARAVGTLVAVNGQGEMAGYVSHGCVDADLSLQAVQAIEAGAVRELVYGTGSPFVDLRLPCGGTVNIMVDPAPDPDICRAALELLQARRTASLRFAAGLGLIAVDRSERVTGWDRLDFVAAHAPALSLVVAGIGPPLAAVVQLSHAMGIDVSVLSPELALADSGAATFRHLTSARDTVALDVDPWTAVLLLFHDHDWEPALLQAALAGDPFYVGALGSEKTHAKRLDALAKLGVSPEDLARIKGPIGVIPAARDAYTLALSALTEIVDQYRGAAAQKGALTAPQPESTRAG